MDFAIESLKNDLLEFRRHLNFIEQLKIDILPESVNYEYSTSPSKRKFDYNSIIISLYGLVENYIEKFCFEYTEIIEKTIPSYDMLESKFIDNHFNLSIELVKKLIENKHLKFSHINKEKVINNLNNCIVNKINYKLNKEAFTINTGNLKHSKICETIGFLNIKINEKLKCIDGYSRNTENAFSTIDNLVQRRNEIAHGNVENILDSTTITPFVDFVEKYLNSIGQIMKLEILQIDNLYKKNYHSLIISDIKLFKGNIIGITDNTELNIKEDDEILIEKSDNTISLSKIIGIKCFEDKSITIKLNMNIRGTYKYYKYSKYST
jgi:hypothetical protein